MITTVVTLMTADMSMTVSGRRVQLDCVLAAASEFFLLAQAETGGNSRSTSGAWHVTLSLTKQQKAVHVQSMTGRCLSAAGSRARVQRHQRVTCQRVSQQDLQGQQWWRYLQEQHQHCWLLRMLLLLRLSRACRPGGCAHR